MQEAANAKLREEVAFLTKNFKGASAAIIDFAKAAEKHQKEIMKTFIDKDKDVDVKKEITKQDRLKLKAAQQATIKQQIHEKGRLDIAEQITKNMRERLDLSRRNVQERIQMHGEEVRHNLKMRSLYRDQRETYEKVIGMITSQSRSRIIGGGVSGVYQTIMKGADISRMKKELAIDEAKAKWLNTPSKNPLGQAPDPDEIKRLNEKIARNQSIIDDAKKSMGSMGRLSENSKMSSAFESITAWAGRNKAGIIISAASIGLLFMTFKKLLSVSPMLQKMIEVMNLAFNLVLRPFGDFIGFILRPIAMQMLQIVMPFFKAAYPFLMSLGSAMGEKFAKGDILGGLGLMFEAIKPSDVLAWIFGTITGDESLTEDNTGGMVGATGAVIGGGAIVGTVGGSLLAMRATRYGLGKLGLGGGGASSNKPGWTGSNQSSRNAMGSGNNASTGKTGRGSNIFKNISSGLNNRLAQAAGAKLAAKGAIIAASKAMLAFKLSNPIGWALLGWEGVTSAIKHFDPALYQQMRESTEFLGIGREFIGLGENSLAEHGVMANDWLQHQIYGEDVGLNEDGSNPETNVEMGNTINPGYGLSNPIMPDYQTPNQKTIQITFNIDKVEKGVDVNMIALQVKSILETNDRFVTN